MKQWYSAETCCLLYLCSLESDSSSKFFNLYCRMQPHAITNAIKLQAPTETTSPSCCFLHLLDIWFFFLIFKWNHWWINRKLILFHQSRFLLHSIIMWLQRVRSACLAKRSDQLMAGFNEVQFKSPCSALDLLHQTHLLQTKQLHQATPPAQYFSVFTWSLNVLPTSTSYHGWEENIQEAPQDTHPLTYSL